MDGNVQTLINAVARGEQNLTELRGFIATQDASIKKHVSHEFEQQRARIDAQNQRERILDSLYFPELKVRQESIKEAHRQTFEWIFHDSDHGTDQQWYNFVKWLREDQTTYWINGKAGSGKSTLMNTIDQDKRTTAALKVWAGTRQLITPTFFFWNSGTELQKTTVGLLRSLLFQIIEAVPNVSTTVLGAHPDIGHLSSRQLPLWTEARLSSSLYDLLEKEVNSVAVCMFIDGLDEFTGSEDVLLSLFEKLFHFTNIKLCVSSRPLLKYEEQFRTSPMLKLQDLTEPDIEIYVSDRLSNTSLMDRADPEVSSWMSEVASTVQERAEGVFLWVEYAVDDQLKGIYNRDNVQTLRKRLYTFPRDLEGVYTRIIQRIDSVYREEVALCCQMVLIDPFLELDLLSLAMYDGLDQSLRMPSSDITMDTVAFLEALKQNTTRRLQATCSGLLEVDPDDTGKIRFIHRTGMDFLHENDIGRDLLEPQETVFPKAHMLLIKASMLRLLWLWSERDHRTSFEEWSDLFELIARAERVTGKTYNAQLILMYDMVLLFCTGNDPSLEDWSYFVQCQTKIKYEAPDPHLTNDQGGLNKRLVLFLGLAAVRGVRQFILYRLTSYPTLQEVYTCPYLLCCSLEQLDLDELSFQLPIELLKLGASPNLIVDRFDDAPASSAWSMVLDRLYKNSLFRWYGNFSALSPERKLSTQAAELLLTFVEKGADFQKSIPFSSFNIQIYTSIRSMQCTLTMELKMAPLTMLRRLLRRSSHHLSQIEAIICHAGPEGLQQSICGSVTVRPRKRYGLRDEALELSAENCDEMVGLLEECSLAVNKEDTREAKGTLFDYLVALAEDRLSALDSWSSSKESVLSETHFD